MRRKTPVPRPAQLMRAFRRLPSWWLASAGVEAQRIVTVGPTRWTVCYKVHVVPLGRGGHKASITLWPRTRTRLTKGRSGGWDAELKQAGWYDRCARLLRSHGYRGTWETSPWGRFGDFWKTLKSMDALAKEARSMERLRQTLRFE